MSDQSRTVPHKVRTLPVRSLEVEVTKGPDAGKRCRAAADTISIGTAPGNDLVLTDPTVSRFHLELRRDADRILVEDHGSTNGTASGTLLIQRAVAAAGTVLTLGRTTIRIDEGAELVELELHESDRLGPVLGRAPATRRLMAAVRRAARTEASILLLGETGTGKEAFAHSIHQASARAEGPFEVVDCGALLPTLVASELFGHEKGAFTGALGQHVGAFERANGGTLFLDEIGELPLSLQPTLLGALERRSFRRVGGSKPIDVDVRVIGATRRDLKTEINAGSFREDLYYRLAVVVLSVPPLRERPEDIPLLIEHFLAEAGHTEPVFSADVIDALKRHRWPGNVRELRNFVEASLAMGETAELEKDDASPRTARSSEDGSSSSFPSVPIEELLEGPYKPGRELVLSDFERRYLEHLLERSGGNYSKAARAAGIDRSYLIQMARRAGLR